MRGSRRPQEPRIPPLPEAEWDEQTRALLEPNLPGVRASISSQYLTTIVRAKRLYRHYAPVGGWLLTRGRLPARYRELAVLRTGWRCQGAYEWGEHVAIAHRCGLTAQEIDAVTRGADEPGWTVLEGATLRAVDELIDGAMISDGTWAVLAGAWSDEQLIEFPTLVAHYQGVAYVQNSLRIRLEEGNPGLSAR